MRLAPLTLASLWAAAVAGQTTTTSSQTGYHTDWPRWCGKVYESGYASFEPGGETTQPPDTGATNLYVQFKPRYSIYLEGDNDTTASFVVNAALSPWFGTPYVNATSDGITTTPFDTLIFSINIASTDQPLVENSIAVNATGVEFSFDLSSFTPSFTAYEVVLFGASQYGDQTFTATSSFLYLPENPSGGSATKIDNLNGHLLFQNADTGGVFEPFLPYGYYGTYNGSNSTAAADEFVRNYTSNGQGLNAIIALSSFADSSPVYDSMDRSGLRFMYDLRYSYENLSLVEEHVNAVKNHTALFGYWTADEPDGWQKPFPSTTAAQSLIHQLDPYHPVAVVLNCHDYYFGPYSSGADILMEDVYPIGINSTFSKWNTTCNTTLGDCGCDDCAGNVQDVSARLTDLSTYESWLGRWPLPKFHNPQVFDGEDYWFRNPTAGEARVMNGLAFNRGATGIFGWTWPGSLDLFAVHTEMALVVTRAPVRDFLLSGKPGRVDLDGGGLPEVLDVAYWVVGNQTLVSVVNGGYVDIQGPVGIELPEGAASGIEDVAFGGLEWEFVGGQLSIDVLPAMTASLVILNL